MGLIRAAASAVSGVASDQWKEYFYCEAIPNDVLVIKGQAKRKRRGMFRGGNEDNIISNGSLIAVADGQCMLIVEQGKVVDICAEPGEFLYDLSTEPSVFYGDLSESIPAVMDNIGKRFSFGGAAPKDQRVYYVNTKEIVGNKYGTPNPIQFRVVDERAQIDLDMPIRCFGEYSYRITNPVLFYTNVCSNVSYAYGRAQLDGQMKSELLTALQPAFARISEMGIRYSALMGHTGDIRDALREELNRQWGQQRGIELINLGVSSMKGDDKIEAELREMQKEARMLNPNQAASILVKAQADAMKSAAANQNAGSAMAFMGMNMASQAGGMNAGELFRMGQQQTRQAPAADSWTCPSCGQTVTGKFCPECGAKRPTPAKKISAGWTCPSCGAVNQGKFCSECGAKKPAGALQYRCDKCGWTPADPTKPPKFCPECGDPFDAGDLV